MYKRQDGNTLANEYGNSALLATDTMKFLFGGGDREVSLYFGFFTGSM